MAALRNGFTTGACAAAAAKAAAMVLCGAPPPQRVEISMPDGSCEVFPVACVQISGEGCDAEVRKDAGDDPDITDGISVVAHLRFASDIRFEAGEGVGIVTRPGLSVPPGEPAINPEPRRMICAALAEVSPRGFHVRLSVPGGNELAARTFNPRLGIQGGLSILGTTGRVRPFSAAGLADSLKCSLAVAEACGVKAPVLVPGNIGEKSARRNFRLSPEQVVPVSNLWGAMLDETSRYRFTRLLILGHPGKLAKLTAGEWDTHSDNSPSAVPIVEKLACEIFGEPAATAVAAVTVEGIFQSVGGDRQSKLADELSRRIRECVNHRLGGCPDSAVVLINMNGDILGSSGDLWPWR